MKKFDQELRALRGRVVEMGRIAQEMVSMSIAAIKDLKAVYDKVLAAEEQVDKLQLEIDHEAVRLLTVYSPVAADLRFVLSVSHVNTAIERIGDQAVNLCHNLDFAGKHMPAMDQLLPEIPRMGELVQEMVRDALLAFIGDDAALARATIPHDDLIDSLNDKVIREMLSDETMREAISGPRNIAGALTQILLARSLERMGDQATNICEEVIYMVKGDDVRHQTKTPQFDEAD